MTQEQALAAGLVPLTEFSFPGVPVQTVRGTVDFAEWLRAEGERVRSAGRRVAIVSNGRRVALYVEPARDLKPEPVQGQGPVRSTRRRA